MENENTKVYKEYSERYRFWTNHALTQLGFSVNFFLTIDMGFMVFIINNRDKFPSRLIETNCNINGGFIIYFTVLLITFISNVSGFISILSRLYDLRLTRHIIWVRKMALKHNSKKFEDSFIDQDTDTLNVFTNALQNRIKFITENDFSDIASLEKKFNSLRKQCRSLGNLSWETHKIQILTTLLALTIYGLTKVF